jgi:O-antigen ligase
MPLLALPNSGLGRTTPVGVFDISDYLLVIWIPLLLLDRKWRFTTLGDRLAPWMMAFFVWAVIGVASINARYDYGSDYHTMLFSTVKLAKFMVYVLAGSLAASRIPGVERIKAFHWSLLAAALVQGVGMMLSPNKNNSDEILELYGYKSVNGAAVTEVVLLAYLVLLAAEGFGSAYWRKAVSAIGIIGMVAVFTSQSRGAWVAAICVLLYIVAVRGIHKRTMMIAVAAVVLVSASYLMAPEFRDKVDFTLHPELRMETGETRDIHGVDQGGRIDTWMTELKVYADAPIVGTGFYHRGGLTSLWLTGSHNFFLQMLLETGIVGFVIWVGIFVRIWADSDSFQGHRYHMTVPMHGAIVAAVSGLMGGEYFYGGFPMLAMVLVYATTSSLRVSNLSVRGERVRRPIRFMLRTERVRINR